MVLRLLQWLYPPTRPSPVFPTATLPFWTPWFTYLFLPETLAMWFQAKKFSPSDWLLCLQWALSITACSRCLLNLQFCQMLLEAGETIIHVLKELKKPKKTNKNYKHKTHHPPSYLPSFPWAIYSVFFTGPSYSTSSVIPQGYSLLTLPLGELIQLCNSRYSYMFLTTKGIPRKQTFVLSYRPYFLYFIAYSISSTGWPKSSSPWHFPKGIPHFLQKQWPSSALTQFTWVIMDFSLRLESHPHPSSKSGQFYLLNTS